MNGALQLADHRRIGNGDDRLVVALEAGVRHGEHAVQVRVVLEHEIPAVQSTRRDPQEQRRGVPNPRIDGERRGHRRRAVRRHGDARRAEHDLRLREPELHVSREGSGCPDRVDIGQVVRHAGIATVRQRERPRRGPASLSPSESLPGTIVVVALIASSMSTIPAPCRCTSSKNPSPGFEGPDGWIGAVLEDVSEARGRQRRSGLLQERRGTRHVGRGHRGAADGVVAAVLKRPRRADEAHPARRCPA